MAVFFIFGKPGAGKSLWAMQYLVRELKNSRRTIVTNLPVNLAELNAYIQDSDADPLSRLRLIDSFEEVKQWWRFRAREAPDDPTSPWVTLPSPNQDGRTDFTRSPGPILYILDEIHTAFNARAWSSTGPAALWYLSQHRKLGDDVLLISQTPAQVDKQLRSLSQEWIHLCNLSKLKFMLLWALPNRILWRSYSNVPAKGEPILATGILKVDVQGLARCYDTSQGAGIAGGMDADRNTKRTGFHWSTLLIFPIAAMVFWYGGASLFGTVVSRVLPSTDNPSQPQKSSTFLPAMPPLVSQTPSPRPTETPSPPTPKITAWFRSGPKAQVWFSDGSTVTTPQLQRLTKTTATIQGTTYPLP